MGNPLYDWERMAREDYAWWKLRMKFSSELYDVVRIDHFVGIAHYYSIPAGDDTAKNGVWVDGPGEGLIAAISGVMGGKRVIAEDLGIVIPEVGRMLKRSGYPGMKLMQFGFDSGPDNEYLPCHYDKNVVVYGGTHDNETLAGFFAHQPARGAAVRARLPGRAHQPGDPVGAHPRGLRKQRGHRRLPDAGPARAR